MWNSSKIITWAFLALTLALVAVSCVNPVSPDDPFVTDNRFEASASVSFDSERISYVSGLSLSEGAEGKYTVLFTVDGEAPSELPLVGGGTVSQGDAVEFSTSSRIVMVLPYLGEGEHRISFTLTREDVSRTTEVTWEEVPPIRVEIVPDGTETKLVLRAGAFTSVCDVSFMIDGIQSNDILRDGIAVGASIPVDFGSTPEVTFTIPESVASGGHLVGVTIKTSSGSHKTEVAFSEPFRDEVTTEVSYDTYYMRHVLRVAMVSGKKSDYTLSCLIDGDPTLGLYNTNGAKLGTKFDVTLSPGTTNTLLLPVFESGSHTMSLTLTCGLNSATRSLSWTTARLLNISVNKTDNPDSEISIVSLMESSQPYNMSFRLDGSARTVYSGGVSLGSSFETTLKKGETGVFGLKGLTLGNHILELEVSTEQGTETYKVEFTNTRPEPLQLYLDYDNYAKKMTISCPNNLYKEAIKITIDDKVKGYIKYIHTTLCLSWDCEITTEFLTDDLYRSEPKEYVPVATPTIIEGSALYERMLAMHLNHYRTHQYRGTTTREDFYADINGVTKKVSFAPGEGAPSEGIDVILNFKWILVQFPYQEYTWTNSDNPERKSNYKKGTVYVQPMDMTITVPNTGFSFRTYNPPGFFFPAQTFTIK